MVQTEILMEAITALSEKVEWAWLQGNIKAYGDDAGYDPNIMPQWDTLYEYVDNMPEPVKNRLMTGVTRQLIEKELSLDIIEEAWVSFTEMIAREVDHAAETFGERYDLSHESVRELADILLNRLKTQMLATYLSER